MHGDGLPTLVQGFDPLLDGSAGLRTHPASSQRRQGAVHVAGLLLDVEARGWGCLVVGADREPLAEHLFQGADELCHIDP